jgi:hypothetical protein
MDFFLSRSVSWVISDQQRVGRIIFFRCAVVNQERGDLRFPTRVGVEILAHLRYDRRQCIRRGYPLFPGRASHKWSQILRQHKALGSVPPSRSRFGLYGCGGDLPAYWRYPAISLRQNKGVHLRKPDAREGGETRGLPFAGSRYCNSGWSDPRRRCSSSIDEPILQSCLPS